MDNTPEPCSTSPLELEMLKFWRRKMIEALTEPDPTEVYRKLPPGVRIRPGTLSLYFLFKLATDPPAMEYEKQLEDLALLTATIQGENDAETLLCRDDLRRWNIVRKQECGQYENRQEKLRDLFWEEEAEDSWRRMVVDKEIETSSCKTTALANLWSACWYFMIRRQYSKLKDMLHVILDLHNRFPSQGVSDLQSLEEAKTMLQLLAEQSNSEKT